MIEKKNIGFHIERKSALISLVCLSALFILINLSVVLLVGGDLAILETISRSKYTFSAVISESVGEDDYYTYNASVPFSVTEDDQRSINADVLMQTKESVYTEKVAWNVKKHLAPSEVAISNEIAERFKLEVGDSLISKNVVNGESQRYTISEILPSIKRSRVTDRGADTKGLIIMGYDTLYHENISSQVIAFLYGDVNRFAKKQGIMPTELVYRDDEQMTLWQQIAPYAGVFWFLLGLCAVVFVLCQKRIIQHNFRRMASLGASRKSLNSEYYRYLLEIGYGGIILSTAVSIAFMTIISPVKYVAYLIVINTVIELLITMIAAIFVNKQLWRI